MDKLCFMIPQGGEGEQSLSSQSSVLYIMERGCTSGSFVVTATVNGFVSPWSILIDPKHRTTMLVVAPWKGVSRMRRRWKHTIVRLSITVCLATGTCVTVPEIVINLGVNFLDFNSVERCLVIDLDTRYDHILRTGYWHITSHGLIGATWP